MLPFSSAGSNSAHLVLKSVALYQLSKNFRTVMAVLAYTFGFNALVWMNTGMFRLIKVYSEVPDDSAVISSKSHFNRC